MAPDPSFSRLLTAAFLWIFVLAAQEPGWAEERVEVVASHLEVPWALAHAPDGRLFVTERPGRIRVVRNGRLDPFPVATLDVLSTGESGLMGLAVAPDFPRVPYLYACYTGDEVGWFEGLLRYIRPARRVLLNRVVRLLLRDGRVAEERAVLVGIPGGVVHDGCRLKFGPDGKLYVTTGDAGQPGLAQRRDSLAGKVLRINPDGSIPLDNPFPASPVYSFGHRNPQGLAWDERGRLVASEHGPIGNDEINRILPGKNYGWPEVQGRAGDNRYQDPMVDSKDDTWAPSGIAFRAGDLFVATLRGRRLLRVTPMPDLRSVSSVTPMLVGAYGRLRDVVLGPDGALYITTSNRDGRGTPGDADDRILRLTLP